MQAWRSDINALLPSGISISYADLFQLAGAMAVETAGGPKELYQLIPVGRVDIDGADATTTNLAGPDESYTNITCKFGKFTQLKRGKTMCILPLQPRNGVSPSPAFTKRTEIFWISWLN